MQINENITRLNLRHRVGEWAEEATLTLSTLGGGYQPGQGVSVSVGGQDRDFLLEGLGKRLLPGGLTQELNLLSPLSKEAGRSPGKTQLFLTLTAREYEEFQVEYGGKEDGLEFRPLIRLGNAFGERGWDSNSIIQVLAGLLGIKVHTGLPAYWVKQFTVKPSATFLGAILELVSPLKPLLYSVRGEVFMVAEMDMGREAVSDNTLDLQGVRMVGEEVKRGNISAKAGRLRLTGNLGSFRSERYKGILSPEPFKKVKGPVGGILASNYCYGTTQDSFFTGTDSISFVDAKASGVDPDSGIVNNFSLEVVSVLRGKDVFGKVTSLLSEYHVTHRWRSTDSGLHSIVYSIQDTVFLYENTHGSFASPREYGNVVGRDFNPRPGRVSTLHQAMFYPSNGEVVFGLYRLPEETATYYWYSHHGELAAQYTITFGPVYTEDNETFSPLSSLNKDDISPDGTVKQKVLRVESVSYYQLSRDSYGVRREHTRLNREGRYSTSVDVQIVQAGAVQGSPVEFRKMQVYAEKGIGSESPMESPALEVSVNTPSWESLETILPLLEEDLGHDEVVRTYEVFGELNAALGLQVNMPAFSSLDGTEVISSPGLASVPIVVGYEIEKDAFKGTALTRLTVKGRMT